MKMLIGIVLLGITIHTTNSLNLPTDNLKSNAERAVKGPKPNPDWPILNISLTSSNSDSTIVSIIGPMRLSNDTTISSSALKKQGNQTGGQSDEQSKSKITVLSRIQDSKSLDGHTLGMQLEMREETETMKQSSTIYKQTEATDRIFKSQEPHAAEGTAFPKTKHPGFEAEGTDMIIQEKSLIMSEGWQAKITKDNNTTHCSMMWPECSKKQLDDMISKVAEDLMTFTLDLFKKLSPLDSRPNVLVSPLSVALALSHIMLGADGTTKNDMLKSLYKGVNDDHCIPEAIQNLTTHDSFLSASEIFYNKELHINKEFIDRSSKFYESKGIPLPKDKKISLEKINSWVSQRTKQLIPNILQELPPNLQLILVNVIHYQGKWLSQFDPSLTKNENFRRLPSGSVKVPIMNAHKYPLQILKDTYLQAQVARFPLSDNCSLLIFLPLVYAADALKIMENRLSQEIVNLLITQLKEVPIRATSVSLPQLKLDTNFGLNEALSSLGLYDLFEYPNLCVLSNSTDLAISDVHHRAFLQIKEEGVKAAAASTMSIARTVTVFAVRRPFLFILMADNSRVPIFIGRISDPSQ